MSDTRTLRIALLLLTIYLAGLATGWWLAPREGNVLVRKAGQPGQTHPFKPGSPEMEAAVMKEFDQQLNLTAEQRAKIQQLVASWAQEVRQMPRPLPRLRFAAMERWCTAIRTNLVPDQIPVFDEMVQTARDTHPNFSRPAR